MIEVGFVIIQIVKHFLSLIQKLVHSKQKVVIWDACPEEKYTQYAITLSYFEVQICTYAVW